MSVNVTYEQYQALLATVTELSDRLQKEEDNSQQLDNIWLLISAFLVFFMQLGFGMLEAGGVRPKNTVNILFKNIIDTAISAVFYTIAGYGLAEGAGNRFIGTEKFFLKGVEKLEIPFFLYNWAFSATTSTIVSGCVAERTSFLAYLIYVIYDTIAINPFVVHWMWSYEGWLSPYNNQFDKFLGIGALDFAGSGVVHLCGGTAGFVGA